MGKNLGIKINIENLLDNKKQKAKKAVTPFTVIIEEMTYDISFPPNYERYVKISEIDVSFEYKSCLEFTSIRKKKQL